MKRIACHQNPFQFSFANFPKKHFFNIIFPNVHLCCFLIFPSIYNIVLNNTIICPLLCIRRIYHFNFHRKTKCKNLQSIMYLCHPNSKNQIYVMGPSPLVPKMKNVNYMDCSISNKYLHFIMGVLLQVENGDKSFENRNSMADEKVKRGVSFLLLGFGGESGIK